MKYFLALVPPPPVTEQVEVFRSAWGPAKTPPHITVKAPISLSNSQTWLSQVKALCQRVAPFEVTLAGTGQFGRSVLYIRVVSAEVVALHHALLHIAHSLPVEQTTYFEGASYVPHLTLVHAESGITETELMAIGPLAAAKWAQPITFMANELVVYRGLASTNVYTRYEAFPLAGRDTSNFI